jgi:hypothetical protein
VVGDSDLPLVSHHPLLCLDSVLCNLFSIAYTDIWYQSFSVMTCPYPETRSRRKVFIRLHEMFSLSSQTYVRSFPTCIPRLNELTWSRCTPVTFKLVPRSFRNSALFELSQMEPRCEFPGSDLTLDIMDQATSAVGDQFRAFKANVCSAYDTRELRHEVEVRCRRYVKQAAKPKGTKKGK